ncbi:hypothetical protein GCM10010435_11700 [Winogradskya consettensis]|uniref:Uncharacterized protein n=1 Tax=Winogradskya consettensis TaxID=113560 RepID=A0A919T066_9ACTN|nr:hypothetical protein Aco04nite_69760 [Actinoplanes consettensis]
MLPDGIVKPPDGASPMAALACGASGAGEAQAVVRAARRIAAPAVRKRLTTGDDRQVEQER